MKKILSVFLALLMLALVGCSSESANVDDSILEQNIQVDQNEKLHELVYEDDFVKVSFVEVFEDPLIAGTTYAKFELENKSNQEITVLPVDSAVNDTMVTYLSGMPATIQGGKKFNQAWFFTNENAGIQSADEINTLSFSLQILDENMGTLAESDNIKITVK